MVLGVAEWERNGYTSHKELFMTCFSFKMDVTCPPPPPPPATLESISVSIKPAYRELVVLDLANELNNEQKEPIDIVRVAFLI